jgi:quercetin dioxygenase-like cupin family protein
MKLFHLVAIAAIAAFAGNLVAQTPAAPTEPAKPVTAPKPVEPPKPAAKPASAKPVPAKGMKITKITGTVNIMKDGVIVKTLKPGDPIPVITDNKLSFAVVEGTMEVEAGGKTITASTGSNFTVTSNNGQVNVALGAGAPVAVRTESGNNVVLTPNSEIKMITANEKVEIKVEKGNAVVSNAAGGETQNLGAGQTVNVSAVPPPPPPSATTAPVVTEDAPPATDGTVVVNGDTTLPPPPTSTVNPTQETEEEVVAETPVVSESTP